ncbi:MAG: thioredoxin-disulfide reductase [Desulfovibrionaceae bacterium]|jgi:thioredoxin reductase (NADPH)
MNRYDAVVIGGGPAGLTAALYLLRSGVTVAMLERLSAGGQVLMTEEIENYPGFPKGIKGYELADLFDAHLQDYSLTRIIEEVESISPNGSRHLIKAGGQEFEAGAVIVCSGARYRHLGIPGEGRYLGRGVSYCALCDGNFFRGQDIAVIGGGNTALEESLYLARLVRKLYLVHRRDDFRAHKCYQDKCFSHPKISVVRATVPKEIVGGDFVSGLRVENIKTGAASELAVDGVFIFVGFEPAGRFLPEGLELDTEGFIKTDVEMRTNVPGIFAAGDIRSKNVRQVATAVGDGATAAANVFTYLEQLHA